MRVLSDLGQELSENIEMNRTLFTAKNACVDLLALYYECDEVRTAKAAPTLDLGGCVCSSLWSARVLSSVGASAVSARGHEPEISQHPLTVTDRLNVLRPRHHSMLLVTRTVSPPKFTLTVAA